MPNSDHLNKAYLTSAQGNPDVTLNAFLEAIDNALGGTVSVNFATDADLTLTAAQNIELQIIVTDTSSPVVLTAPRNVILESFGRFHIVKNETAQTLTFKTAAGSGVAVQAGAVRELVYCDGTNVYSVSGQGSDAFLYDLGVLVPGTPPAGGLVFALKFTRAVDFPSSLTGSQGHVKTTSTGTADFDVQKNGSSVGTIRYSAATSAPTFIMASPTSFAIGDRMEVYAPNPADATLANAYFTLFGTRV